jgi:hypothetical protein
LVADRRGEPAVFNRVLRTLLFVPPFFLGLATTGFAQQAVLYELTESAGVDVKGGVYGRHAYAALQGWAKLGTPLCPSAVLLTNPNAQTCTVTAMGTDNISLATGWGPVQGTFSVTVQLDNPVDAPEFVVMTGTFRGDMDLSAAVAGVAPLGYLRNGTLTIDATGQTATFSGTFRMPYRKSGDKRVRPNPGGDAFYLGDDGKSFPVKMDERALGWPTVRFELNF